MWDRCRCHIVFYHCIVSRLAMSHSWVFSLGILEILKRSIVSPSRKCPRECLTRGTHFYVKSAWIWDHCRYHVVFYHCIVSRLAMSHTSVSSLRILKLLNRSIVSSSRKCSRWCRKRRTHFYVKSAWMWDLCRYHVVFYHCIVSRLAMSRSCVFTLGILEIFNSCILSPSLKCPRGCLTRGTHVHVKSAWMWDCCWYHVVFYHCIVSLLVMWQSRIFSLGVLEILNRCIVSYSLKSPCGCLTRSKYSYVKSASMWDRCWYHVVFFHCVVSCLAMWHSRIFSLGILDILNICILSPSLKCPLVCHSRWKRLCK